MSIVHHLFLPYLYYTSIHRPSPCLLVLQLQQSFVVSEDLKMDKSTVSMSRTSHTAWLPNTTHPVLARLALRVQEVAGLFTFEGQPEHMAGEMLQVGR